MKKEIKQVTTDRIRITTCDERWYANSIYNEITGLPEYKYIPSVTWIAGYYPKGIAFYKWLADKGWDEAEAIKSAAGDKGSKVHKGTEDLDHGLAIPIDTRYINPSTGKEEELSLEEVECLLSFAKWLDETKPELITCELTVYGNGYAGTLDRIYRISGQIYIVDIKTSQYIWEEHKLQVSAYSHAEIDYIELGITQREWDTRKLAILQIGYKKNKAGFKFTEIADKYDLFIMALAIWRNENSDSKPKQRDYPLVLKSTYREIKIFPPKEASICAQNVQAL